MQDITEAHLAEVDAAWAEQNLALVAATEAFDTAIRTAQETCAAKLTASRQRAWGAIQERLRVWNGFGPTPLGEAPQLSGGDGGDEGDRGETTPEESPKEQTPQAPQEEPPTQVSPQLRPRGKSLRTERSGVSSGIFEQDPTGGSA